MHENDRYTEERRERPSDDGEERGELPPFLMDPIGVLRRRWLWMLPVLLMGLVASGGVVSQVKPLFASMSTVLITSQQIPEEFVRSTVVEDSLVNLNALVGKTLSLQNLNRLIEQYELYADERDDMQLTDLISRMRERITIGPAEESARNFGGSLIYEIKFMHEDAAMSAMVANALSALMVDASIERRNLQARRTTEFLRRALADDERDLREESRRISEYRQAHRGTLPSELDTNLRRLVLLAERRESVLTQIASKDNQIATLASATGGSEPSESQELLEDLRRQFAEETASNTDAHPNVIALRERIDRLEEVVEQEGGAGDLTPQIQRRIDAEERERGFLRTQLASTDEEIALLNEQVDQAPKVAEELRALEQKEEVLRDGYLNSLRKVEEAEMAESLESAEQGSRVSVLDPAQVPTKPERNRLKFLAAGIVLSFGLAGGIALLFELIDPIVVNARQIDTILARPALGTLPRSA